MAIKVCPKCGELNKDNSINCIICGSSLRDIKAQGLNENEKNLFSDNMFMNNVCIQCGKKVSRKILHCPECGSLCLTNKPRYSDPNYGCSDNIGMCILAFIIPIIGLIVGSIWIANDDYYKKNNGKSILISAVSSIIISSILLTISYTILLR